MCQKMKFLQSKRTARLTGDASDAILTPLGRVVIFVFAGSTKSGNGGSTVTPSRGKSSGGRDLDFPGKIQLNNPPRELVLAATALELAYLPRYLLPA